MNSLALAKCSGYRYHATNNTDTTILITTITS